MMKTTISIEGTVSKPTVVVRMDEETMESVLRTIEGHSLSEKQKDAVREFYDVSSSILEGPDNSQ